MSKLDKIREVRRILRELRANEKAYRRKAMSRVMTCSGNPAAARKAASRCADADSKLVAITECVADLGELGLLDGVDADWAQSKRSAYGFNLWLDRADSMRERIRTEERRLKTILRLKRGVEK